MLKVRSRFSLLIRMIARSFLYAILILPANIVALQLLTSPVSRTTLTLVLFLEGGLGLLLGVGISLSSTPSITRLGETLFGTSAWSQEAQKYAESVGLKWMLVSAFLVVLGFAVSAL